MRVRSKRFEIDRSEGKILGVCSGIANHTGIDTTIIRVVAVVLALAVSVPWTVVAYLAVAFLGRAARPSISREGRIGNSEEASERIRSLDLRMQAIEIRATSANSRLAREIEELR